MLQIELLGQGTDGLVITGGAAIVQGLALYGFQTAIAVSGQPGVWVQGCFIGTDAAGGETFIGNVTGVSITGTVGPRQDRRQLPRRAQSHLGNTSAGLLFSATSGKLVRGNLIGTDPTGTIAIPNGTGIRLVDATGDKIGGIEAVERNVISGSFESGVVLSGGDGNIIQGNIIGADATGSQAIPNGSHGLVVEGLTTTFDILHNQISGNAGDGVHLDFGAGQTEFYLAKVTSNVIGMEFASEGALGNGGAGVRIVTGNNVEIWGNAIRHNQAGVLRMFPTVENGVVIRNNSIHDNVGEGIAFGAPGFIPPNQPNGFLNFPLIHFAVQDAESAWIYGFYRGRANAAVTLDFYLNPPCDKVRPGEFAEGKAFVWTMNVITDSLGGYTFSFLIPLFDLQGRTVTATATTKIYSFSAGEGFAFPTYHTSAFSQRLPFAIAPRSVRRPAAPPSRSAARTSSPATW